ncbi:hypothetical protein LJR013_003692 [Pseudarthrobacter oxydans]
MEQGKGKGKRISGPASGWHGEGLGAGPRDGRARSGPLFRPKNAGHDHA